MGAVPHSMAEVDLTCWRSWNFWILPVEVLGSTPKTTRLGTLKRASWPRQNSMISASVVLGAGLELDKGAGHLAPLLVGQRHHGGQHHRRVAVQDIFDLDGLRCSRRRR
jgi:hypothetical protein